MNNGTARSETARRMSVADVCNQVTNTTLVVTIVNDDIQDEIEYWSSAVICYVLGGESTLECDGRIL